MPKGLRDAIASLAELTATAPPALITGNACLLQRGAVARSYGAQRPAFERTSGHGQDHAGAGRPGSRFTDRFGLGFPIHRGSARVSCFFRGGFVLLFEVFLFVPFDLPS